MKLIKNICIATLIFISSYSCISYSLSKKLESFYINCIINKSNDAESYIFDKLNNIKQSLPKSTKVACQVKIPYESISDYLKEFTHNIPYAPKDAPLIKTKQGLFRIWQNDDGIICAPDPKDPNIDPDEWRTRILLSHKEFSVLKLLFLIDKTGKINIHS